MFVACLFIELLVLFDLLLLCCWRWVVFYVVSVCCYVYVLVGCLWLFIGVWVLFSLGLLVLVARFAFVLVGDLWFLLLFRVFVILGWWLISYNSVVMLFVLLWFIMFVINYFLLGGLMVVIVCLFGFCWCFVWLVVSVCWLRWLACVYGVNCGLGFDSVGCLLFVGLFVCWLCECCFLVSLCDFLLAGCWCWFWICCVYNLFSSVCGLGIWLNDWYLFCFFVNCGSLRCCLFDLLFGFWMLVCWRAGCFNSVVCLFDSLFLYIFVCLLWFGFQVVGVCLYLRFCFVLCWCLFMLCVCLLLWLYNVLCLLVAECFVFAVWFILVGFALQ